MKIFCFAPHSAIWVHTFPEALVIESLRQSGHEIVYVTCGGVFDQLCVSMGAYGVGLEADPQQKKAICKMCTRYAGVIRSEFGFGGFDLASMITPEDRTWVAGILCSTSRENFLTLKEDGVELGRIALSNFLMSHKKCDLEFSERDWRRYLVELENTLLAFVGCRKILDREHPDRIIVYEPAYAVNFVCCKLARHRGIPHYRLMAGGNLSDRLQRIVLSRGYAVDFLKNIIAHWPAYRDRPSTDYEIQYTVDHVLELLKGTSAFVYSAPSSKGATDLRGLFGIRPEQKVLLATTSSYDEIFSSQITGLWPIEGQITFPTVIDWLGRLLSFVEKRQELFLIVRIHPREFPNKRDGAKSEHARQLESLLSELSANVRVNWPDDRISLYDLAQITDVVLNAWSSAGKELALLGIPVVTYAPDLLAYPEELNYIATSPDAYFAQVETALRDGWSVERARRVFRWYALEYHKAMFDLSESYAYRESAPPRSVRRVLQRLRPMIPPTFMRVVQRLRRMISPTFIRVSDCQRRAPSLSQRSLINDLLVSGKTSILDLADESTFPTATLDEETQALREGFRRLLPALYGSRPCPLNGDSLHGHLTAFVNANDTAASAPSAR